MVIEEYINRRVLFLDLLLLLDIILMVNVIVIIDLNIFVYWFCKNFKFKICLLVSVCFCVFICI